MSKPRCAWETVMPGQMERFTCRCAGKGFVVAQTRIQQDALRPGRWKFTHGTYALPGGGGIEESYIYLNPWQDHELAERDAVEMAQRAASVVCQRRR
jgi:hypothetical protein